MNEYLPSTRHLLGDLHFKNMLRTGTNILRTNVLKKCFQITIKVCYSQRCTSIAPKTETVTRDSKLFKSDMSRKSGLFFKSVPYVTETGAPM